MENGRCIRKVHRRWAGRRINARVTSAFCEVSSFQSSPPSFSYLHDARCPQHARRCPGKNGHQPSDVLHNLVVVCKGRHGQLRAAGEVSRLDAGSRGSHLSLHHCRVHHGGLLLVPISDGLVRGRMETEGVSVHK